MKELIKIQTNEVGENCVSARELHEGLKIKSKFNDWMTNRIKKYGFEEKKDFILVTKILETNNPKNPTTKEKDYIITIDMAKELCMVENSEIGRQFRKYFIDMTEFKEIYGVKVNKLGQIISLKGKMGIGSLNNGYRETYTNLKKNIRIHRLVAELFIPNLENKPYVNHIDGNKQNNCVFNLEWVTASENEKHAYDNNLKKPYWERKNIGARSKPIEYYIGRLNTLSNWKKIFKRNNWIFNEECFIKDKENPIIRIYKGNKKISYKYKYIGDKND